MSNIEEVLFHSLQRFDLKDAEVLQKYLYDYLKNNLSPGILGNVSGKISADPITATFTTATEQYITTTAFDYFSSDHKFCTAATGLSFDGSALKTYFTNYFAANGNVTGADTWYVWARPETTEEELESREFFSSIDNATETREVNTRVVTRSVLQASRTRPDATSGWTRVANIIFTVITVNGVDTLAGPTFTALTFTDFMSFGLQDIKTPGTAGIQVITYAIEEAMRKMLSDGVEDLAGTTQTQPGSQPTMSLEGLTKFVKEQTYSKRGHIVLEFRRNPSFPSGTLVDENDITKVAPYLPPVVVETHRLLGFAGVVCSHSYDDRRFIVPLDDTYIANLLSEYGLGTNQLQDVNVMFKYPANDKANNVNDYFDPLVPDTTYFLARNESVIPQRFLQIFGDNGPWVGVGDAEYATVINGVDYANSTGIGIIFPLCKGANTNLDTLGTPNIQEMNKIFIDYNSTTGSTALGNLVTGVLRYMEPPTFQLHLIVKG